MVDEKVLYVVIFEDELLKYSDSIVASESLCDSIIFHFFLGQNLLGELTTSSIAENKTLNRQKRGPRAALLFFLTSDRYEPMSKICRQKEAKPLFTTRSKKMLSCR